MVKDRLSLHEKLVEILGSPNVYFQPPANINLRFPCIIYKVDNLDALRADNKRYLKQKRYLVTIVDRDPETTIPDRLLDMDYSSFSNHYCVDNLNHYICSVYW